MAEDPHAIHAIDWPEVFPGLRLLGALRASLHLRALALAALAVVGTIAGWRIIGTMFSGADTARSSFETEIELNSDWPWVRPVARSSIDQLTSLDAWRTQSPLVEAWRELAKPFARLYAPDTDFIPSIYWLSCALWSLLVWSFFGGAISRMAAVRFAREENLSWGQLAGFVRSRIGSYFVSPLFPILGTFLISVFLAVVGLVLRADFGVLVAGIAWPLVLLGGFAMAFLLIGLFFAWPLMWGAISAEGTDAFGALSHGYSYTYQRPLHYLLYAAIAAGLGVLGWYLVSLFADWTIAMALWGVGWGSGAARLDDVLGAADLGSIGNTGRTLITSWHHLVWTLALAFVYSYFWTATTYIYFLLRRLVDATEIDEVYLGDEQELYGMPPLKRGPDGIPDVADEQTPAANP